MEQGKGNEIDRAWGKRTDRTLEHRRHTSRSLYGVGYRFARRSVSDGPVLHFPWFNVFRISPRATTTEEDSTPLATRRRLSADGFNP